jgi:hypothetical protein
MNKNFVYASFLAAALSMTACDMDTFNEQDAINAQKELLTLKYTNETELEKLRQAATTALEQLKFTNLLEQMRLQYELQEEGKDADIARARQDYSIFVTDMNNNLPLVDVEVSVASEGQVKTVKTNASGIAVFDDLALPNNSRFIITKEGYAAASIAANELGSSPVSLMNIAEANRINTIQGKVFIETDLTNETPETVPANTLVTAVVYVDNGSGDGYNLEFPTRTDENGNYTLKLPDAYNSYTLKFANLSAGQKLYVNGAKDNGAQSLAFPETLPRVETINTHFSMDNIENVSMPYLQNRFDEPFYYRFEADTLGKVGYSSADANFSATGDIEGEYKITSLYGGYPVQANGSALKFKKNDTIAVTLVDFSGKLIKDAPKLVAYTNGNGQVYAKVNGGQYIYFSTNQAGVEAEKAGGVFKSYPESASYNEWTAPWAAPIQHGNDRSFYNLQGGKTMTRNFTYGFGYNRDKEAY